MDEPYKFRSMGCDVVVVGADRAEQRTIEHLFIYRDRTFSRFLPGSELNRVNAADGRPIHVSKMFAEMLGVALQAERESDGLVTPTLGAELEAAGYDADFASLADDARSAVAIERTRPGAVGLFGQTVVVPPGVRLDLNGVVKGKTVDDALALTSGDGFVSAGGDLATRGSRRRGTSRRRHGQPSAGRARNQRNERRRWLRRGVVQHHLIDPSTGAPASSPWAQVTVCGLTCVGADVAAKAAFLLGYDGPAWLDLRGLPGRFISDVSGEIV